MTSGLRPSVLAPRSVEQFLAICVGMLAVIWLTVAFVELAVRWDEALPTLGADYWVVRNAAERWLDQGVFYLPEQLAGKYTWPGPWVLYPPTALILLVPFVYLPPLIWWLIPIAITAWAVARHHPRPLAWAAILLCLAESNDAVGCVLGNPALWLVAGLGLGSSSWGWPSVVVLFKPTLFPFAVRRCRPTLVVG